MSGPFEIDLAYVASRPHHEQLEIYSQVQRMAGGLKGNPLWGVIPHAKQIEYLSIDTQVGAFLGGNRSGKSFAGTLYDILQVVDEECVPPWLLPYKHWVGECAWRVATPTLKTTLKQVVLPLFELMFPKDQLWKGSWDRAYHNDDRILTLANGNTIDFLTYEMKVDAFSGAAKHGIRLDEEPQGYKGRKIYEESMARLLSTGGDFRMTFTPLYGLSWSYHELTVKGVPRNDDEVKTVTVDMDDNPHLDERTKRLYLSKISPAMRKARKAGEFIHFEGLIYPEWDDSVHVIPEHQLPRDERGKLRCEVYVGIDPGRDHPLAIVWAYAMDGRLVIFDSIKLRGEGTDAESIAHMIAERNHVWGCRPRWYVIDPSARNKAHATGRSMQDELRRHGISTRPGQNARMAGYSRVAQLLRDRVTVDGRKVPRDEIEAREAAGEVLLPRLQVTENNSDPENEEVPGLVEEFPLYRWKPRSVSANEGPTPQEPIKVKDDALDAMRYLIMSNPTELIVPEDEDLPPENPNEYEAWARAKKLRDHVETLMQRKRGRGRRRDNPGVVT